MMNTLRIWKRIIYDCYDGSRGSVCIRNNQRNQIQNMKMQNMKPSSGQNCRVNVA